MQKLVSDQGIAEQFLIESAGTHAYHVGELADRRMRHAGENRGYQFLSRARKIVAGDLNKYDLILAMDLDNLARIKSLSNSSSADVKMLGDFLDDHWPEEVPDPYYGGNKGFEKVLDMIEAACPKIIAHLLSMK